MYTLIRERVASMYELTYVYNLDEMLILAVDGVTGVGTINLIKDAKTRTLRASFTATTTEGEIESEVELSHVGLRSDG